MKLSSAQKNEIKKIAKKFNLNLIIIFGSFVSGKMREDSDIDIAVSSSEKISFKDELSIIRKLTGIFKRDADLVIINKANPLLLQQIDKNGIMIYGRRTDYINFKLYVFHRYNDYLPYFKLEERLNKTLNKKYAN
ncbi:nucleotidyltransferase domain-containing protein [Patescibacteria group bacterium]|nr:nucleotidyltransferase domain-containing protein [Patescibacteria group bacterium]MBU4347690.1 nucleotidyltransferase domain-containing protein [Patescibacteria group bacterium]